MRRALFLLAVMAWLAGCGPAIVLEPYRDPVPVGVDFSGRWALRENNADTVRRIGEAEWRAAGGDERILSGKREPSRGTLVHVFLETGHSLKVTQTAHGLFISYDRAVVEEYRFGEHREVSVGAIAADRVSGWRGEVYVVETLDENDAVLRETWRLAAGGKVLQRSISIVRNDKRELDLRQVFDRK